MRFYVLLDTKKVILETLFPANLLANTEEIQPNTIKLTKSNIHQEDKML